MSPLSGRDGLPSHTGPTPSSPYSVSPTTSSNSSLRNNASGGTQPVLSSTLIPRDYLASLSKSRLNATDSSVLAPHPPSPFAVPPSGVSSQATALALSQDQSSDESGDEENIIIPHPDRVSLDEDLKVSKTRSNVSTTSQRHTPQKSPTLPGFPKTSASVQVDPFGAMPRTSSIDSAISTISNSSYAHKPSAEQKEPTVTEIRNLIATAGSAENLVQHLLRDKAQAASQNAQLWKLVDKQRALLLGLNKDLEKVSKERDRYRKKVKDLQALPLTDNVSQHGAPTHTPPTSAGAGEEPHPVLGNNVSLSAHANEDWTELSNEQRQRQLHAGALPVELGMMPSPLHLQQTYTQKPPVMDIAVEPPDLPVVTELTPVPRSIDAALDQRGPKLSALTTQLAPPAFSVTEATPLAESPARALPAHRKAPPKPLDLKQMKEEQNQSQPPEAHTAPRPQPEAEADERGRRKTREQDDRERELTVLQEQEARSRSKKEKRLKGDQSGADGLPTSPKESSLQQQASPRQLSDNQYLVASLPTGDPLHRAVPGTEQPRLLSPPLRSPGLPASPRPVDRSLSSPLPGFMSPGHPNPTFPMSPGLPHPSLPMSPRNGGMTLSPRAPKQPVPAAMNIHSQDDLSQKLAEAAAQHQSNSAVEPDRLQVQEHNMGSNDIPPVYRGLVSPTWPDLLLPPNALPSIQVKVASSRLRPSRFSVLGFKPQEDTSVFSLSVYSRSNAGELWRLEKIPAALPHLEQQLRPRCPNLPRLPDRKLFTGHAPATLDTRRNAIDSYFEELLDTHVDEQSALIICKFLSTDVLEPQPDDKHRPAQIQPIQSQGESSSKLKKTGYLTKKGKNFGGWKSRYFVLDSQDLRYFEAPGGAHLGTIKLYNAKIGRQTTTEASQDDGDTEGQFRHAFLILEPKRKDSTSYVRHVLCAENDAERDDWVRALLYYVEESNSQESRPQTSASANEPASATNNPRTLLRGTDFADSLADSAAKSSSPTMGHHNSGSNSPTTPSPATPDASNYDGHWPRPGNVPPGMGSSAHQRNQPRQVHPAPQMNKEQKIRNLFQFRKASHEQLSTSQSSEDRLKQQDQAGQRGRGYVRPVFGLSLAEAVEVCPPQDVNVLLPAVVYRCIEYLRGKNAANEEGLFRLSGSNLVIRTLKERFNTEGDVDLLYEEEYYDVHAVASLFKSYLRELPSTLLTRDLHIEFLKVLELDDKQQKIFAFNALVHQLPRVNFSLLRTLSEFLLEVVQNSNQNKMTVKNVCIVFSPTLNIPAPVFAMFLTDFDAIFNQTLRKDRQEDVGMMATLLAPPGNEAQPEVRSPRHQIFSNLPTTPALNQNNFNATQSVHQNQPKEQPHQLDPPADFGMAPVQSSAYESRNYVSIPSQPAPPQPLYPPPQPNQAPQPPQARGQYRMFAPEHAANDKAKRRESAMLSF